MSREETINRIASYLTTHIPDPPEKPKKPRKTWHKLEPGRELKNILPVALKLGPDFIEDFWLEPGWRFKVISVDDQGVWLSIEDSSAKARLEDRGWETKFKKLKKQRSKRKSVSSK